MTAVLLAVAGAVLVGLPLLALALDRVLPPPRHRPPPPPDPQDALRRRFRLSPSQLDEVESAVRQGRLPRDPALRPAVRAAADQVLVSATFRGRPVSSYPLAVRVAVLALGGAAAVAYLVALTGMRQPGVALTYALLYGGVLVVGVRARRRRRQRARDVLAATW